MTTESSINLCISTNQPDTKPNHNINPTKELATKQHVVVSTQLKGGPEK